MKIFHIAFLFLVWVICIQGSTNLPSSEYNALYQLYNSTQGSHWNWHASSKLTGYPWVFEASSIYNDPCSSKYPWQGVYCSVICTANNCHVFQLKLSNYNLTGTIPSEISQLNKLSYLDLNSNKLSGTIPSEINALTDLSYLYLHDNQLNGTIPSEICQLTNLLYLYLDTNLLTGTIPSEINQLINLNYLYIHSNQLNGSIPSELCLLTHLTAIYMYSNKFTGTIPSEINQLTNLQFLDIYNNHLTGTIPSEICQLTNLIHLNIQNNFLIGSIPSGIGQMIALTDIYLSLNYLTGTIPSEIGNLVNLSFIYFNSNKLKGSIPNEIGQLIKLKYLDLDDNRLTGTIPSEIGNLVILSDLYLSTNRLSGSLPNEIGQLKEVMHFNLENNQLTGTIPSEIGQLTNVIYLILYNNQFFGSIPFEIGQLPNVSYLNINDNLLTGSIPSEIGKLSKLTYLDLDSNQLIGTIPLEIGQLLELSYLYFDRNQLTRLIPSEIGQLINLISLDLSQNLLTESIPDNITNLDSLSFLSLANNYLTSQFLSNILLFPSLVYIDSSHNFLSKTISLPLFSINQTMNSLLFVDFSSNLLTGTFPFLSIYQYHNLSYLNLANNYFIGSISDSFQVNSLQILYLQNNCFTGSLPENVLGQGHLKVMIASTNCFFGSLPASICQNKELVQLNLDGLHSSTSCITKLVPWTGSSSYMMKENVGGTIPSCLFDLENLLSLHLSGNNFHGSLPSSVSYNSNKSNLTMLNLANNRLAGSIPAYLLSNPWIINLDLSFNQFNAFGEDISEIEAFSRYNNISAILNNRFNQSFNESLQSSLRLHVNHLSGHVPPEWMNTTNIDILEGNMFGCKIDRSDLPRNDLLYDSYQCGSDNTNISLYCLLGLVFVLIVGISWVFGKEIIYAYCIQFNDFGSKAFKEDLKLISELHTNNMKEKSIESYNNFNQMLFNYEKMSVWSRNMMIWLIVVISTMYISLTWFNGTYTHQYVWILSSSYLSGFIAASVMLVIYSLTLIWYLKEWKPLIKHHQIFNISTLGFQSFIRSIHQLNSKSFLIQFCFLLLDILLVLLVNIGYIIALNHGYTSSTMTIISICISIFKLVWNHKILLGKERKWFERTFNITFSGSLIMFLCLFNNIIIPYIAEAFVSPNCFLYVITNPPKIESTYYNVDCKIEKECNFYLFHVCKTFIKCDTPSSIDIISLFQTSYNYSLSSFSSDLSLSSLSSPFISSSYLPPFHYNFTCSSSLLSAFSFVFIYRYLISVILLPTIIWFVKKMQKHPEKSFKQLKIKTISFGMISTYEQWFAWLTKILPVLMKFEYEFPATNNNHRNISEIKDIETSQDQKEEISSLNTCELTLEIISQELIIDIEQGQASAIHLILDLTMLMSFGMLFPPLGLLIIGSIMRFSMNQIHYLHRFVKYLLSSVQKKDRNLTIESKIYDILFLLNEHYQEWNDLFAMGVWWTIVIATWFWGFCLYDTLGNSQGEIVSLWIMLLMGCGPYIGIGSIYLIQKVLQWITITRNSSNNVTDKDTNILKVIPIDNSTIIEMSSNPINQFNSEVPN